MNYFSRQAAGQLIGRKVKARWTLPSVPAGTVGIIKWIDEAAWDAYGVVVLWQLPNAGGHTVDAFNKSEFARCLSEV